MRCTALELQRIKGMGKGVGMLYLYMHPRQDSPARPPTFAHTRLDDKMNGRGTYRYSDGSVFEGSWVDSKMHGKGVYVYPNHDRYEGEFADDMKQVRPSVHPSLAPHASLASLLRPSQSQLTAPHPISVCLSQGFGVLCYRNGEKYEGNWQADTAHGKGTLTYAGGDKYVGEWAEGKKHGVGELHYVNGDVFQGEWRNDFACGHGVLAYANGDAYDGQWLNDRRHGHGKFTSAQDGKEYEGQWRDGMRHGTGLLQLKGGDALRAQWENGLLVQCLDFQFAKDSPWHDPKY